MNDTKQRALDSTALATRHVFIDTEAFRSFGHNISSPPWKALALHIAEGRVLLHTTDITLMEVKRHIAEDASKLVHEVNAATQAVRRWNQRATQPLSVELPVLDAERLAENTYGEFYQTIIRKWGAYTHQATGYPAEPIFRRYFEKKAPFDGEKKSKEFPDAFVIAVLEAWCESTQSQMYVITADKAMQRAAEETGMLIPLDRLQGLLGIATADGQPELIDRALRILDKPEFLASVHAAVSQNIADVEVSYSGNLIDGEAYDVEVNGELEIEFFSVLAAAGDQLTLLVIAMVPLLVRVEYVDLSSASYDKEDQVYFGKEAGSTEIEDSPQIRFVLVVDQGEKVREIEFITQKVSVAEEYDSFL